VARRRSPFHILIGAAFLVVATTAHAGVLDGPEVTDYRQWESNRCYVPPRPSFLIRDPLTFNLAVEAFNDYLGQIRAYLDCLNQEAQQDMQSLQRTIDAGRLRHEDDALRDTEIARDELERYRALYAR